MPASIADEARRIGAQLLKFGEDFHASAGDNSWSWTGPDAGLDALPKPALHGAVQIENAATVLMALHSLRHRLPVSRAAIELGLRSAALRGRFQVIPSAWGEWILDVAHNPAAAMILASTLKERRCDGRTIAVIGMFADKDVAGVVAALQGRIDSWVVAGVSGPRALAPDALAQIIKANGGSVERVCASVSTACEYARSIVRKGDRIAVFGSFHTVGPALEFLNRETSEI
jgi:dihydrofolate synthase/folylpolyglutamate synthase